MSKSSRLWPFLFTAILLGVASCGDLEEPQTANDEPVPVVAVTEEDAPIDEVGNVEDPVSESRGPDLELWVSAGGVLDDVVGVTIEIRSIDTEKLESPEVLLHLGNGVALAEGNGACALNFGELRCLVSAQIDDDSLPTASAALDVYFEVASDAVDPSVRFTAESASNPVTLDADPSNNVVTVVFVRTVAERSIVSVPLPDIPELSTDDLLPEYTLEVHSDGCGVFRTGEIGDDLTWVVTDQGGFQVLGRNAAGETQYRFFRPGIYTVALETWGGGYYVEVSNEVTIAC